MSKQEMRTRLNDLSDQAIAALDANQWELYLTIAAELDLLELRGTELAGALYRR